MMLSLTEIKESLYKQNPKATFHHCRKVGSSINLIYVCCLFREDGIPDIIFEIPTEELTDGLYFGELDAQLLIRYIVQPETLQHDQDHQK